ncbi:OstA-like protein [Albibacterium bauzanense]|uniref:OstA-like protein n=1 Tax=Albibacterium bauzanense TaxID=653929 RepID=A0A4R1LWB0_9SPHI|nr:OstA-like protein [Albibacterium bauzanense]TCK82800.1 OstA-like protein [Albibacterium bauzanense]
MTFLFYYGLWLKQKRIFEAVKKIIFFLIILLFPTLLLAQQTITVVSNTKVTYDQDRGSYRWYHPVFAHEGSTLAADSSDFNEGDNFFDAYGHVVITQPNGTVVYADKLHYTESTQQALLTGNVRLVDRGATLTTNYLTYNMKSKIGSYHGGGKIINGTDTLDSTHGYYFENTQDAYFRENVVVRSKDAIINTDTMRYNSNSKVAYFYGPTNIKGGSGNLYTENGDYNTETDQAKFGKNNLYTEGSKFLRGDSLYYDGVLGNGRAVKNVVFIDTAQKIVMRGQLGVYTKATQTTVVTQNAYIVLATEDSTSTSSDSTNLAADSTAIDSLSTKPETKRDSTFMTADTLFSQVIPLRDFIHLKLNLGKENDSLEEPDESLGLPSDTSVRNNIISRGPLIPTDSLNTTDSLSVSAADSLTISTVDSLMADSIDKADIPIDSLTKRLPEKIPDTLNVDSLDAFAVDSTFISPVKGTADSLLNEATKVALQAKTDTLRTDTGETRIVKAYHNVKIFKSDLQAIADSAYYGYADSIIRCYGKPIIWSQGSQLSADTVYMLLKNQKMENVLFERNAFMVNTQLDSIKFNQVKGRKITGYFKDNNLDRIYVDGNAESIYFTVEEEEYTGMLRSISSRIKIKFEDNKMTDVISIRKAESVYYPIASVPAGQDILEGFIWKPELRPKSKEEIIPSDDQEAKAVEEVPVTEEEKPATENIAAPAPASEETPAPTPTEPEPTEENAPTSEQQ